MNEIRNRRHSRRLAQTGTLRLQSVSHVSRSWAPADPDQRGLRRNPRRKVLSDNRRRAEADRYRHAVSRRTALESADRRNHSGEAAPNHHESGRGKSGAGGEGGRGRDRSRGRLHAGDVADRSVLKRSAKQAGRVIENVDHRQSKHQDTEELVETKRAPGDEYHALALEAQNKE